MADPTTISPNSGSPNHKFSRYRSVRRAIAPPFSTTESTIIPSTPSTDTIIATEPENAQTPQLNHGPSRYRRRVVRNISNGDARTAVLPPLPALPVAQMQNMMSSQTHTNPKVSQFSSTHDHSLPSQLNVKIALKNSVPTSNDRYIKNEKSFRSPVATQPAPVRQQSPVHQTHWNYDTRPSQPKSKQEAHEEARMILEGEYDRLQKLKRIQVLKARVQQSKDASAQIGTSESHQWREELKSSSTAHPTAFRVQRLLPHQMVDAPHLNKRVVKKPSMLQQENAVNSIPPTHTASTETPPKEKAPFDARRGEGACSDERKSLPKAPAYDAPISAVNAGARRVNVRCNTSTIMLPVTPMTTARDLVNAASVCMSEPFDLGKSVLIESFSELGLEREVRKYERIRDVMNSWVGDEMNHFLIASSTEWPGTHLEEQDVLTKAPGETCLQLYHSSKPRKWEKRWVRLRSDGQITVAKNQSGLNSTSLCHLSDFDVHSLTQSQFKVIKPAKKFCVVVKSFQKSAMFLDGVNYTHYFSSSDQKVIDRWRSVIQEWRSWYLINVLEKGLQPLVKTSSADTVPEWKSSSSHKRETLPYQLGSFTPLLDFGSLSLAEDAPATKLQGIRERASQDHSRKPLLDFSVGGTGLERRNTVRRSEDTDSAVEELGDTSGFTGKGLLARSPSRRSQNGRTSGRGVAGVKGKPLVDLAPVSEFTDGSLLRNIEAFSGHGGIMSEPRIDRSKRVEADVRVGEGII